MEGWNKLPINIIFTYSVHQINLSKDAYYNLPENLM